MATKSPSNQMSFFTDGYDSFGQAFAKSRRQRIESATLGDKTLFNAYKNTTLARQIIDIPATDAVRNGRAWNIEDEADREAIEKVEQAVNWENTMRNGLIRGSLYGGCAIYIGVDGTGDASEPLDPTMVKPNALKRLRILPKGAFGLLQYEGRLGAEGFGEPVEFPLRTITNYAPVQSTEVVEDIKMIHRTRLVIIPGERLPQYHGTPDRDSFWGISTLQARLKTIEALNEGHEHLLGLLKKSRTSVIGAVGLANALKDNPEAEKQLASTLGGIADATDNFNIMMLDAGWTFNQHNTPLTGMVDAIDRFMIAVAGAAQIPATKLYGMSPAGQNATGISDQNNYFDRIKGDQMRLITSNSTILDQVIARSAIGDRAEGIDYTWNPLNSVTKLEEVQQFATLATTLNVLLANKIISEARAGELGEVILNELNL